MKLGRILFLWGMLSGFFVSPILAQSCLKGRVQFEKGIGKETNVTSDVEFSFTTVYANDLQVGTSLDSIGFFHICDIPEGEHVFTVSCMGYETVRFNLKTKSDTFVEVKMPRRVLETSELIITGISSANELKTNAQAMQIVDSRVWDKNTSQGLVQTLSQQAGVSAISTGVAIAKPVIRGLGYNRIVTVSDGVRQEGQQWGDEHGIELDDFGIAKVEILKGPGSLLYGSDAIAGVINVVDPLPDRKQLIKGKLMLGYNSNNGQRTTAAVFSGGKGHWSYLVRASSKDAHCYQNKRDGFVANSGFNNSAAKVIVTTHRKWGYSQLIYSGYRMNLGIIEGERDSLGRFVTPRIVGGQAVLLTNTDSIYGLYELQYPRQDIFHQKVVSNTRLYFGKRNVKMLYAYQENVRKEMGSEFQRNAPDLWMRLKTGTYQLQMNDETNKQRSWSVGTSGMIQASKNYGAMQLIADYHLMDAGLYGMMSWSMKMFTWQAGVRYDHRWMQWDSIQKGFGGVSGSVGASYKFAKAHYLKLNISRGYRAPNAAELTSNGVHEGALRYELGNKNLKAEHSLQADIQLLFNWSHLSITTSLFQNNVNNFIYINRVLNTRGSDSLLDGMQVFAYNGKSAVLRGFELQYDYHPHPLDWLHIGQSLSYVTAHFEGEKNVAQYFLPTIPPMRLTSNIQAEFPRLGQYLHDLEIGFQYQYVWRQTQFYSAFQTETGTAGYGLLNASISSRINTRFFESMDLVLSGNNLTDVIYQDHLSRLKYAPINTANGYSGVWNMGRSFSVKLVFGI